MIHKTAFFFLFMGTLLAAKVLTSPLEAMKEQYGDNATINKKNIILSNIQFLKIQKDAKHKLHTKIYRIFTARKGNEILGYGILVNNKVRSKNAVVLYFIAHDILLNIEIIAFNETLEYLPSKTWNAQFQNIKTSKMLKLSRDIPSITGATLSARSLTDASRIAFSIYNELLKGK